MRTSKSKKLPRRLMTVTDYSGTRHREHQVMNTSDTTDTMTIIVTTISTHSGRKN